MPFVSVLEAGLLIFCVLELLADGYPRMQKQIYYLAFAFAFVWSTMKFAYGPDIMSYIPYYRTIGTPSHVWDTLAEQRFEAGFVLFTSLCKSIGMSYWLFTALISTIYFGTIYALFRKLNYYPTIALTVLMSLDNNLFLIELRQCLAVSFFILGILSAQKDKNLLSIVLMVVSASMHHSAKFIIILTILLYLLGKTIKTEKRAYAFLFAAMILLIVIPVGGFLQKFMPNISVDNQTLSSSLEHISRRKFQIQKIIIIYLGLIGILAYYLKPNDKNNTKHWLIWCCVALIVFIYDYWFLLNRIRSYFLPFLIVYTSSLLSDRRLTNHLPKQIFATLLLVFFCFDAFVSLPQHHKMLKFPTDKICLVTDLRYKSEEELTEEQMRNAINYWEQDYKNTWQ